MEQRPILFKCKICVKKTFSFYTIDIILLIVFLYKFLKNTNNIIGDDMEKKIYDKLVYDHRPQEKRGQNAVIAFLIGGITGVIGELLVEFYDYYFNLFSKFIYRFRIL